LAVQDRVSAVRAFNRFYTNEIGVLREGLLGTPYSLTEARVLFELGQVDRVEVSVLRRELDVDRGYLSRILARLEAAGLVTRTRSTVDGRGRAVRLSPAGHAAWRRATDDRVAREREILRSVLGDDDLHELNRLLGALLERLEEAWGAAPRRGAAQE
jgi:DNA-binding MarR family transcriptional regulator